MRKITLENGKVVEISEVFYNALAGAAEKRRRAPKRNQEYYYVTGNGYVTSAGVWTDSYSDEYLFSQRNVFKTEEEAEKHLEYLKALAVLKDDAEDFEPDWSDEEQVKYFVVYRHGSVLSFGIESTVCTNYIGSIYFETREQAQHSIDTHRDEWLTVFGVER